MITRLQFIKVLENIDWGAVDKDFPALSFIIRNCEDLGYTEQIAQGKITSANDIRVKASAELFQKGIEFVPIIGDVLSMIFSIGGVDLSAFKSISDSGTARQRLYEWINWINANYKNERSGLPPLTSMNERFIKATAHLIQLRPKCVSPSESCNLEHARYIVRATLLKECQQNVYEIYYNHCVNDFAFSQFINQLKSNYSGGSGVGGTIQTKQSSALPLLIGLGLLFGIKK